MSGISISSHAENGVKAFIRNNPLFSMYILMFAMAWSVMIPQALYTQGVLSAPLPGWLEILSGWAPGIAAVLVSGVISGGTGIRELLRRFGIWRVGARWYIVGFFLLAAIILGGIGLHVLSGGTMPFIPAAGSPLWDIALTFLVFVVVGFLINTEEIAWRGFALPRLQARYGALIAAVLITIPEVILHLPLYWVRDSFIQRIGLDWFSAFSAAAVFIYVYVFNKTRGSLLIVTILHASQNAWSNLLSDNSARPFYFTVALIWAVAIALMIATRGTLGYESETSAVG